MAVRVDLQSVCRKKDVLDSIQCYEGSPSYSIYEELFDDLIKENADLLNPVGYYVMTDTRDDAIVEDYDSMVCCVVTLGKGLDLKMNSYFAQDDYMKGVLISSMADTILFNASNELYHQIFPYIKDKGMMMTKRKEPGTSGINVTAQKWILDTVNGIEATDIKITTGYMLDPTKSMGYFYGAGKDLKYTPFDHDCSLCDHIHCHHRKVYATIKTDEDEFVLRVKRGTNLLQILREHKIPVQADCSGNKTCGKCKVKVISERLTLSEEEKEFLTQGEIDAGMVLACFQNVMSDIVVEIKDHEAKILSDFEFPNILERKYIRHRIDGLSKSPEHNESATDLIHQSTGKKYGCNLSAVRSLSSLKTKKPFDILVRDDEEIVLIDESILAAYGIGIDVGTTTLAIALIDLLDEKVVDIYKCMNPQKAYGADVISRIQYANEHDDGMMTKIIHDAIVKGIGSLMEKNRVAARQIVEVAVAGNTTMQYLLAGIDPIGLAASPFLATHLDRITVPFAQLFHNELLACNAVVMPGLSAYIGSDILAGIYTTGLVQRPGNYLFIDIGTNGELAIQANGRLVCVATAAGPAFEGANITCGMGSLEGAICAVTQEDDDFQLEIIGDGEPKGICGSGLVDLMALCLERGLVDETGRLLEGQSIPVAKESDGISLYQNDIRELQLAKAAIAAGIEVLLQECGCTVDELDGLLLAGGFGHHLNVDHAIRIGLLPDGLKDKTQVIGNSSLAGSIKYLLEKDAGSGLAAIKDKCDYIELSTNLKFYDYFIDYMSFS